jgi:hypothetical protein
MQAKDYKIELQKSPILKDAKQLKDEIRGAIKRSVNAIPQSGHKLSQEMVDALRDLLADLTTAKANFVHSNPKSAKEFREAYQTFANTCRSTIYEHYPALIAAPNWIDQLKAHINAFSHKHFRFTPFQEAWSSLGSNPEFRAAFFQARNTARNHQDAPDPSPDEQKHDPKPKQ